MYLKDLVHIVRGRPTGSTEDVFREVASPSEAGAGSVVFVSSRKDMKDLPEGVLMIAREELFGDSDTGISVDDPRVAMMRLLEHLKEDDHEVIGIHPSSAISPEALVHPDASVGPFCVVEKGANIGRGAVLKSHVFIGSDSVVGEGTFIAPNCVIYKGCVIGRKCMIHSGSVLGADGFGFIPGDDSGPPVKIPQLGGVKIGDHVEIGACCTVDRGTISDTVINDHVKMDDHVHIAHNVVVGKGCILVAMTGLAGSSILEDGVIMAARSGTGDHVRIGKGAQVAAMAGAIKDVPPGAVVSGFPARDHKSNFRIAALTQKLPDLFRKVKELDEKISCKGEEKKL